MTTKADRHLAELGAELRAELRALPREGAGEGFTERVLERLDEPARGPAALPGSRSPWRLAAAAALAALLLGALVWRLGPAPETEPARPGRRDALAAEHASLAAELDEIRRLAEAPVPVLYLGGDDEVELVLDLAELAAARDRGRPLPADYRPR